MRLETERLLLRPWQEDDAVDLFEWARDPAVGPAAGWPPHTSAENSRQIIRDVLSAPETYAICRAGDRRPVGSIGLFPPTQCHTLAAEGEMEIGYWIAKPFWGQGYVPEAVRGLIRRAFEALGARAVWCGYYEGNEKSRRCMGKCGFEPHHRENDRPCPLGLKQNEYFSLLRKERWESLLRIGQSPLSVESERLTLCLVSPFEIDEMIGAETNAELRQAYSEMAEGCRNSPSEYPLRAPWKLFLKEGPRIGDLCFKGLGADGSVEIGYGLQAGSEGCGFMTEAVKALTGWVLRQEGVRAVEAETEAGNPASRRVLEKAGFRETGETGKEGPRYRLNQGNEPASARPGKELPV